MEWVWAFVKTTLFIPIIALPDAYATRLCSRFVKMRRPSFKAAYMLSLMTGAVLLVLTFLVWPLLPEKESWVESLASFVITFGITAWLSGYYFTTEEGKSIGFLKGAQLTLFTGAVLFLALLVVAGIIVLVRTVWGA